MSYEEEYYCLHNYTKTWTYILEEEYHQLKPYVSNALPKTSLAPINIDADRNPQQAKYRIFVLGNLDPKNWSRNEVFDTVLFQIELRLLITIAF